MTKYGDKTTKNNKGNNSAWKVCKESKMYLKDIFSLRVKESFSPKVRVTRYFRMRQRKMKEKILTKHRKL